MLIKEDCLVLSFSDRKKESIHNISFSPSINQDILVILVSINKTSRIVNKTVEGQYECIGKVTYY